MVEPLVVNKFYSTIYRKIRKIRIKNVNSRHIQLIKRKRKCNMYNKYENMIFLKGFNFKFNNFNKFRPVT